MAEKKYTFGEEMTAPVLIRIVGKVWPNAGLSLELVVLDCRLFLGGISRLILTFACCRT